MTALGRVSVAAALGSLGVAGVMVVVLAVLGFDRTYHYVPERLVTSLGISLSVFVVLGVHALRRRLAGARTSPHVPWVAALAGLGVSYYAVGYLLAGGGVLLFAGVFAAAAILVAANLSWATLSSRRILLHAAASSIGFLLPGVLIVLPLYTTTIYLPGIFMLAFAAATFGLLHAAVAFSGLARVTWGSDSARDLAGAPARRRGET